MKFLNSLYIYKHISNYYYTDGYDVYHKVLKEKNAKKYRIRYQNKSYTINQENCENINQLTGRKYVFDNGFLYRKLKWFVDKDGYEFMTVDSRKNPKKIARHRLVYFFNNNKNVNLSGKVIDHIDRNRRNNDIDNLRLVTSKVNANNINKIKRIETSSKYVYECKDIIEDKIISVGIANEISNSIGIGSSEINRYAKYGYIYRKRYLIKILKRKEVNVA